MPFLGGFLKQFMFFMDLYWFMVCGAVLYNFLNSAVWWGSCRPEGQGKGQVVLGSMEVRR